MAVRARRRSTARWRHLAGFARRLRLYGSGSSYVRERAEGGRESANTEGRRGGEQVASQWWDSAARCCTGGGIRRGQRGTIGWATHGRRGACEREWTSARGELGQGGVLVDQIGGGMVGWAGWLGHARREGRD